MSSAKGKAKEVVNAVASGIKNVEEKGKSMVGGGCRRRRAGGKTRRKTGGKKRGSRKHPRKGQRSRTRKGRKDFVTHKGDKTYNRRGHRQYRKCRPYTKRRR
jgi:hypothetical protein